MTKPMKIQVEQNRMSNDGGGEPAHLTITDLQDRTGPVERLLTDIAKSRDAGRAIRSIERRQIGAKTRIADTAITIFETQVTTAMVTRAVPVINGMIERLNSFSDAADQSLTQHEAGAIQSHLNAREANKSEILELSRKHGLAEEEAMACISFVEANAADDINRAQERTRRGKEANDALHERALASVLAAKLPRTAT